MSLSKDLDVIGNNYFEDFLVDIYIISLCALLTVPGESKASPEDMKSLYPLMQLVFHMMERVRRFRLGKEVKWGNYYLLFYGF